MPFTDCRRPSPSSRRSDFNFHRICSCAARPHRDFSCAVSAGAVVITGGNMDARTFRDRRRSVRIERTYSRVRLPLWQYRPDNEMMSMMATANRCRIESEAALSSAGALTGEMHRRGALMECLPRSYRQLSSRATTTTQLFIPV
jgi:hypothetical protein